VLGTGCEHQAAPFVVAGDLNTGNQLADRSEGAGKYYCSDHFDQLASAGGLLDLWRLTNGASREWTWHSTKATAFRSTTLLAMAHSLRQLSRFASMTIGRAIPD
jgi:hypothetical protein